MKARRMYLAAPFFNPLEQQVVGQIEGACEALGHIDLFSPRRDGGNAARQGSLKENAGAIFYANLQAMRMCTECLAWLDRPQPKGREVWLTEVRCYPDEPQRADELLPIKGPLEQPDLGTIWELGFLRGFRDVVIESDFSVDVPSLWCGRKVLAGFTEKPREHNGKMNIMLAKCLDVMIHGWDELKEWLNYTSPALALEAFQVSGRASWTGDVQ